MVWCVYENKSLFRYIVRRKEKKEEGEKMDMLLNTMPGYSSFRMQLASRRGPWCSFLLTIILAVIGFIIFCVQAGKSNSAVSISIYKSVHFGKKRAMFVRGTAFLSLPYGVSMKNLKEMQI